MRLRKSLEVSGSGVIEGSGIDADDCRRQKVGFIDPQCRGTGSGHAKAAGTVVSDI
jgi:hypothetical protein